MNFFGNEPHLLTPQLKHVQPECNPTEVVDMACLSLSQANVDEYEILLEKTLDGADTAVTTLLKDPHWEDIQVKGLEKN